jgi:hypothetical protein
MKDVFISGIDGTLGRPGSAVRQLFDDNAVAHRQGPGDGRAERRPEVGVCAAALGLADLCGKQCP